MKLQEFFLVNCYLVTFDIVTDRRKTTHKSPPALAQVGSKTMQRQQLDHCLII